MLEKLALQKGLISREDYDRAVAVCASSEDYENSLKEYFIANGLISAKQLAHLLRAINKAQTIRVNIKFGQIAVRMGFIDEGILARALETQKKNTAQTGSSKLMGQILFEWGKLTRDQVGQILRTQKRLGKSAADNRAEKRGAKAAPEPVESESMESEPVQPGPPQEVSLPPERKEEKKSSGMTREALNEAGMILEIQADNLAAYLTKTPSFSTSLDAETVCDLLSERGIFYGVVTDEMIQGFIRSSGFKTKRFRVARGKAAIQGRDAVIQYFFETDYLKIGGMDDKGTIDFKERGEIPKISKGFLLAEKTPVRASRNGRDIFDRILEVPQARDAELKTEVGAVLSQDGNRLFADRSGYPQLTWAGHINVLENFIIKGNVGYETGHVSYDGDVQVKGCLKSGFKITCRNLAIGEVDGGEIIAREDVTILDGVNDARIHTKGNLTAKFVHHSNISGLGHVRVIKEIVDSKIRAGGTCDISKGEMINSEIHAGLGVHVKQLGSRKSHPNTVYVGTNTYTDDELEAIDRTAAVVAQKMETLLSQKTTALEKRQRKIGAAHILATQLEMTGYQVGEIEGKSPDQRSPGEQSQLRQLLIKLDRLDRELGQSMDQISALEIKVQHLAAQLSGLEAQSAELDHEKRNLDSWQQANKGNPMIVVEGEIISDTIVAGPHARKEFRKTHRRVKIREAMLKDEESGREDYTIEVYDHR